MSTNRSRVKLSVISPLFYLLFCPFIFFVTTATAQISPTGNTDPSFKFTGDFACGPDGFPPMICIPIKWENIECEGQNPNGTMKTSWTFTCDEDTEPTVEYEECSPMVASSGQGMLCYQLAEISEAIICWACLSVTVECDDGSEIASSGEHCEPIFPWLCDDE